MDRQLPLPIFPGPHRLPVEPRDPNLDRAARPRLGRQSLAVLDRLREGLASNIDLARITHRFGGRLYDLRKAGCTIVIVSNDHRSGVVVYRLAYEPEGLAPPTGGPSPCPA
jgi:hypothetical protein